jgi:AcrR family transcriptional regulator
VTSPPTHRRGATVEAGILDATVALLSERGFAFSVDEVAERAGVHRSNIYRRWETKPQLVSAVLHRLAQATVVVRSTGDVAADLRDAALQLARSLRAGPGRNLLRAALAACATDPEMADVVRDFFAARYATVVPVIQQGVADGKVRADVDPGLLWQAVANPMHLDAVCGVDTSDERARALVDLMLAGARGRERPLTGWRP